MSANDVEIAEGSNGDVTFRVDDHHVATVEIHRPPNNFFDNQLIRSLAEIYEQLESLNHCRAIVLCSEGKNFCAGADFADRSEGSTGVREFGISALYQQGARLFRSSLPVVAAIQGAAVGGGLGLACSADFRVTCPEARFSANFARLGFHQGFALSVSLPGIVGQQQSLELLLTGRRIGGEEAFRIGLCDRLVEGDNVRTTALALATEIAESAPLAVRSIRSTMRRHLVEAVDAALDREATEQIRLQSTSDFVEGVRAMTERRTPRFEGQ
jgi:enoyl-CoA hydratase/carnithine racemase